MRDFRMSSMDRKPDPRPRLILGLVVFMLFGFALAFYGARIVSPQFRKPIAFTYIAATMGVLTFVLIYGMRAGFEQAKFGRSFALTDADLTQKRTGWPDIRIELSQINALHETPSWLIVRANDPQKKIAIPREVEGYYDLRAALAHHSPLTKVAKRSTAGFLLGGLATAISIASWGLMLQSRDILRVKVAGSLAAILLTWSSFRLYRSSRQSPKRHLVWAFLGIAWITALLLIGIRIFE
jgi:hypothetical protein